MTKSKPNWKALEEDVAALFNAAGYTVQQNVEIDGQEFDVIAIKNDFGGIQTRIAIECKHKSNGTVGNSDVQEFVNAFEATAKSSSITHGIILTNGKFSRNAHAVAKPHPQIKLMTLQFLETELFGSREYLENARKHYRSDFSQFIDLQADKVDADGKQTVIVEKIANHCGSIMKSGGSFFTILLGDFGSGKTTIAEQCHAELARDYLNGTSDTFPIILYLRTFDQHDTQSNFVESHLKLWSKDLSVNRIQAMRSRGKKIALILDGFDEVASSASKEERMRLFARIMSMASIGSSVLLTSRPSYFNNLEELNVLVREITDLEMSSIQKLGGRKLMRDREGERGLDKRNQIMLSKLRSASGMFPTFIEDNTLIFFIRPLDRNRILSFLRPHTEILWAIHRLTPEDAYDRLSEVYDLSDLMTRPLLLEMCIELLLENEIKLDGSDYDMGPVALYMLYVNYHLGRDWGVRRFLTPDERMGFARAAAVAMHDNGGSLAADFDSIWQIVKTNSRILKSDRRELLATNSEGVATDVRVCAFMNVTPSGRIEFSHRSFMEFFVSEVIFLEIMEQGSSYLLGRTLGYEILQFLGGHALLRAEVRNELRGKLQTLTARSDDDIVKKNVQIALLFSEEESRFRDFGSFSFDRIKISRKAFSDCRFDGTSFHNAILARVRFSACSFTNFSALGEVHDVRFEGCKGSIVLPDLCIDTAFKRCRGIAVSSGGKRIRFSEIAVEDSAIYFNAGSSFDNGSIVGSKIDLKSDTVTELSGVTLDNVIFAAKMISDAKSGLPTLRINGCEIYSTHFEFIRVSSDQLAFLNQHGRHCTGVIVVDEGTSVYGKFAEMRRVRGTGSFISFSFAGLYFLDVKSFNSLKREKLSRIRQITPLDNKYSELVASIVHS